MKSQSTIISLACLFASVYGHGKITSPTPRVAGPKLGSSCGSQVLSQQSSDSYGNIQGEKQVLGSDFDASKCNLWLCQGYQFADTPASAIQSYTAGQTVPIKFDIRAPHKGVANVSIVDTATNTVIGAPLINWSDFADNAFPIVADQLNFEITIPTDLGTKCITAGECVIQHFWDARSIDQTYESCIDFTISGAGSGDSPSSSSTSSSVSATTVTTTAAATTAAATTAATTTTTTSAIVSSTTSTSTTTSAPYVPGTTKTSTSTSPSTTASSSAAPYDTYTDCPYETTDIPTTSGAIPTSAAATAATTTTTAAAAATTTTTTTTSDAFTTHLPHPSGGSQKYICFVDEL